jgi:hypothetical protein
MKAATIVSTHRGVEFVPQARRNPCNEGDLVKSVDAIVSSRAEKLGRHKRRQHRVE